MTKYVGGMSLSDDIYYRWMAWKFKRELERLGFHLDEYEREKSK